MSAPATQLATATRNSFMPALTIAQVADRRNTFIEFARSVMIEGIDYGKVPGVDKSTLLKPGAEKLNTLFGLTAKPTVIERMEDWTGEQHGGEPFFHYHYRYSLFRDDQLIAEADGSCNSRESKYRWRWVSEADLPPGINKDLSIKRGGTNREPRFAIERAETGGKYGKPAAYWQAWRDAIEDGKAKRVKIPKKDGGDMDGWEMSAVQYRVPNEDVASQVNTILKMAQKRALIAATLLATNASETFTQDVEEMDFVEVPAAFVEATIIEPKEPAGSAAARIIKEETMRANGQPPASTSRVRELERLIEITQLADDKVRAWFIKAGVDSFDQMTADQVEKCIAHLETFLPKSWTKPDDSDADPLSDFETFAEQFRQAAMDAHTDANGTAITPEQADQSLGKFLRRRGFSPNPNMLPLQQRRDVLEAIRQDRFDWNLGKINDVVPIA